MLVLAIYFYFIFFGTNACKELVSLLCFVIQKNLVAGDAFSWKGEVKQKLQTSLAPPAPNLLLSHRSHAIFDNYVNCCNHHVY